MRDLIKPRIVLSRCFLKPVRYDAGIINNKLVEKLKNFVEFIDLCPEVDIGLGVPRPKIIVTKENESKRLIQLDNGQDLTEKMIKYVTETLKSLSYIDGFLLKSKSPSCGVSGVKLYSKGAVIGKTYGFFAEGIKKHFLYTPIEDEGKLKDKDIRFHFLTRVFAFAELRQLYQNPSNSALVKFHSKYKYLLMTYNQKALSELGRIAANEKLNINEKIERYFEIFPQVFKIKPSRARHVNTLMHIFGHVSKKLNPKEKSRIINLIEKYKKSLIDLEIIIKLIKSLAHRFENVYILNQKYLNPFPEELLFLNFRY